MQAPENASGQLDRLEAGIMGLAQMPGRFRKYEKGPWKSRGLHMMPVDNYCVLYIVKNNDKVVTILRVMYSGRDIDTQLSKNTKTQIENE